MGQSRTCRPAHATHVHRTTAETVLPRSSAPSVCLSDVRDLNPGIRATHVSRVMSPPRCCPPLRREAAGVEP
eukprot:1943713-Prymnesium_polylepis.1